MKQSLYTKPLINWFNYIKTEDRGRFADKLNEFQARLDDGETIIFACETKEQGTITGSIEQDVLITDHASILCYSGDAAKTYYYNYELPDYLRELLTDCMTRQDFNYFSYYGANAAGIINLIVFARGLEREIRADMMNEVTLLSQRITWTQEKLDELTARLDTIDKK